MAAILSSGVDANGNIVPTTGHFDIVAKTVLRERITNYMVSIGLSIPSVVIQTKTGSNEVLRPKYVRGLVLDTQLKSWGSINSVYRVIADYAPVNDKSFNPLTNQITSQFTLRNQASTFGIVDTTDQLFVATEGKLGDGSFIDFGLIAFTQSGMTRYLEAKAFMSLSTEARLSVLGSLLGNTIDTVDLVDSKTTSSGIIESKKVMTGKWFIVRVSGDFQLKGLEFSGEVGGLR